MVEFSEEFGKRRELVVTFDHHRNRPEPAPSLGKERPYLRAHRLVIRGDQLRALVRMAGEVKLDDTLGVDGFDELAWLEIVVEAGNENVVDIEQQQTIG